jgi:pimeloyl-ACP methyl ester carboxylesterase
MSSLNFSVRGQGTPVILLHGFPFNSSVWTPFAEALSNDFQVFTPDLPGFGKSPLLAGEFSIDDVGNAVIDWINKNRITNAVIVGHSLGGYVALSMVNQSPQIFSGLVLFHSTALADNPEKKENRNKVLSFIESNGVIPFTSNFIEPLFHNKVHPFIQKVRDIAIQGTKEAVVAYTKAMRDRNDRQHVLKDFGKSVLFLTGAHDSGISVESVEKQAFGNSRVNVQILENAAHMGMFEEREKCLEAIKIFVRSNQP